MLEITIALNENWFKENPILSKMQSIIIVMKNAEERDNI